ncbi:MAG TPA: hypothetical protein VGF45_07895, partial [Polyangia bacterium]
MQNRARWNGRWSPARALGARDTARENARLANSSPHVAGFVFAFVTAFAGCGVSNSERPYLPG